MNIIRIAVSTREKVTWEFLEEKLHAKLQTSNSKNSGYAINSVACAQDCTTQSKVRLNNSYNTPWFKLFTTTNSCILKGYLAPRYHAISSLLTCIKVKRVR